MKTAAVTIGIGTDFSEMSNWTGSFVEKHLGLEVRIIDEKYQNLGFKKNHWLPSITSATVKISIFNIFPDLERIVFFDADWRPVRPFNVFEYCPDPEKIYFTIDRNHYSEEVKELEKKYNMSSGTYFNSGFFVVSRSAKKYFDEALENFYDYEEKYFDQCVLNHVLKDKITYADKRLNVQDIKNCTIFDKSTLFPNSEVLAYHSNTNWNIMKGYQSDFDWSLKN
jgi:lipopolysaccharide biosynthesis glycosyltransferase